MPQLRKVEVVREEFYSSLGKVCDAVPNDDMKSLLGDFNAKVGKEYYLYPACGGTAFTTKRYWKMNGKFCTGKRCGCDRNIVSI